MFKQFSIQQRFYLFLIAIVLICIIAYQMAIKNTVDLHAQNSDMALQLDSARIGASQINELKSKLDKYKLQNEGDTIASTDVHQEILNTCSKFCADNHLYIKEFPENEQIEMGSSSLEINRITVEGSFANAVRLVELCEKEKQLGQIVSVSYNKQKASYTQKEQLLTTIFFQHIISKVQ